MPLSEQALDQILARSVTTKGQVANGPEFISADELVGQTARVDIPLLVAEIRSLNTPEPPPLPSNGAAVWDLVIADIRGRDAGGTVKYGQRLTVGDGRRSLVDLYQELLDAVVYVRKEIEERRAVDEELAALRLRVWELDRAGER